MRGGADSRKFAVYHPRDSPMVSHGRHFVRLRVLRKWQVIEVIEVSGLVFGSCFSAISTVGQNLTKFWGAAGTVYAYGFP